MLLYLGLGVSVLAVGLLILRAFVQANPAKLAQGARTAIIVAVAAVASNISPCRWQARSQVASRLAVASSAKISRPRTGFTRARNASTRGRAGTLGAAVVTGEVMMWGP